MLKVWDLQKGDAILEARQQEEYISVMAMNANRKTLLTISGNGTLCVFSVKRQCFELVSEPQNRDLTSVALLTVGRDRKAHPVPPSSVGRDNCHWIQHMAPGKPTRR
ncbi:WD repeat-containing protein 55-like [Cuculus canorus]|uniref:WD repeat-containing protein 55-like n=1 Tax=Cuculus canorus TaxID=55661 RepID=UPI0023AADA82|nr:WD repeat-containing protein 55-like [Cuculus canorus]